MSVPTAAIDRVVTVAKRLESQGFFEEVRKGDQKAASLFARLVAWDLNPSGDATDFGCLSKSPGETQVDGFAEDAIVYGNDPADRENVLDLVNGAGANGAKIADPPGVKPRREHNRWVKPQPLTTSQLLHLRPSGKPPEPPPPPAPRILPKGEAFARLQALNAFYAAPEGLLRPGGLVIDGKADMEAIAQWFYQIVIEGVSLSDVFAQIRASHEYKVKHPEGR